MTREHRSLLSLRGLARGRGRSDAVRVWLALWSHARVKARHGDVWPSNARVAELAGLDRRRTQRALALLRVSGKISIRWGIPWGCRNARRIITLAPGVGRKSNPRIRVPGAEAMPAITRMLGEHRDRPGSCVGLLLAIYALASQTGGRECFATLAALRDITGSAHGQAFYRRLAVLEASGLIHKIGGSWADGIRVEPIEDAQRIELHRSVEALPAPPLTSCAWLDPDVWEPDGSAGSAPQESSDFLFAWDEICPNVSP